MLVLQSVDFLFARDIEKFLKGYGRIRNISVKEGYGFAEFDDRRDAEDAVKVNDARICLQKLYCCVTVYSSLTLLHNLQ